ncbi:gasdermin C [Phyllostomus discolor]|uniref:Gasdermin C n=1 Tax=Phyllostomus discolor TaxID=89673 RepID=A0A833ZYI3_9CHIR|nr:gasdermin C [Phyllostomus discolor]
MPSMFEKTARKLVKEIGDKDLRPVTGVMNANKIRRFSLIRRKKARSMFWQLPDVPVDISLMDILEPSVVVPDAAVEVTALFSYTVGWSQHAGANVNAGADASVLEETTVCQGSSLDYKIVSTQYETWTDLQKRKVMDPEPSFLKQCRRTEMNLYVVTDIVELRESCVLEDHSGVNVSGKFLFKRNPLFKVEGGGGALKVSKKTHTVPEGSVLAYKRKQLVFLGNSWERIQEPPLTDFKHLQQEVSREVSIVGQLSKDFKDVVFSNILDMLGDREPLQDLLDMLAQEPLQGHLDGPGGTILNELQKDPSYAWNGSQHLILYLLEAIMALSDMQHCLLAPSMEKKILSQQRDLVRSILEPNFKYPWSIPFTLKPEFLAPLQGDDLAITYDLLEECGLKMELHSPRSTWDLGAKKPLSALYGALCVLQQLAEA